LIDGAGEGT